MFGGKGPNWYEGPRYRWLGIDREEWAWALVMILGAIVLAFVGASL